MTFQVFTQGSTAMEQQNQQGKKPYQEPELFVYGDVRQVTQAGVSSVHSDNIFQNSHKSPIL
jgi:hypothetical protein